MSESRVSLSAIDFAKTHYKTPAYVEHGIRCGKPNCKCAGDYRHGPYAYLYWRDEFGKAHRLYVRKAEADEVREIIELRQAIAREWRVKLAGARGYIQRLDRMAKEYGLW